jgi:prepilin-type processing-associated H-X9-DG protein
MRPGRKRFRPGRRGNDSRARPGATAAFSLLELLIVIALMLVMFVVMYGGGSRGYQQKQLRVCQGNLKRTFVALEIYANDHEGAFPVKPEAGTSEAPLSLLVPKYTSLTEPFICPGSKDTRPPAGEPFEKRKISYAYYMGRRTGAAVAPLLTDRQVNTLAKEKGQPVFSRDGKPPGANHNKYGGNALFTDGHAEASGPNAAFALPLDPGVLLLNPRP